MKKEKCNLYTKAQFEKMLKEKYSDLLSVATPICMTDEKYQNIKMYSNTYNSACEFYLTHIFRDEKEE